MIRILLAHGHAESRERLRQLLERQLGWRICGEASNGYQAVDLAVRLAPQVAVLDLALPEMNALEAVRRIRHAAPETEAIVLTAHETDDLVRDLLVAGAGACIATAGIDQHLVAAVDSLSQHRPYLTPTMMHAVLAAFLAHGETQTGTTRPYLVLTPREREILQLLAEGRSNASVSELLSISVKTVETHRATMMKKLGVGSLAELVRYAIRNRVVDGA